MKQYIKIQFLKTPYGELILGSFNEQLCLCDWRYRKMRTTIDNRIKKELKTDFVNENSTVIEETKVQLIEYINKSRSIFNIPLLLIGTDFQKIVWNALMQIPYGRTESYLSLSKTINNRKAIRAVASANGANAIAIIIPCHRIIGSDGSLVGYAGGLLTKEKLLQLENPLKQLSLF